MARRKYYIKATLGNGVSGYDKEFLYHLGLNTHPSPDRKSKEACGEGIHLAKNILIARDYVDNAKEFYLAMPGEILGEDKRKIRTDETNLICRIPKDLIEAHDKAIAQAQKAYDKATAPAWGAYAKATAPAWRACEKAIAQAQKAYCKARVQAHKRLIAQVLKLNREGKNG